ncbi:hypothetical protein HYX17_05175 [Candidatus Woesearchaeota archaeon]|nr:hypothetical protein [Candidatus Woesearchaeota archaeon]
MEVIYPDHLLKIYERLIYYETNLPGMLSDGSLGIRDIEDTKKIIEDVRLTLREAEGYNNNPAFNRVKVKADKILELIGGFHAGIERKVTGGQDGRRI